MNLVRRPSYVEEEKSKTCQMVCQRTVSSNSLKNYPRISAGIEFAELGACEWVELRKMEDSEDKVPTYCSNDQRPSPKRTRDCESPLPLGRV